MDYLPCSCPCLSQASWYEPTTPTPWSRFKPQFKGAGKRHKAYTPTRAYYPRQAYYPIEAYYPTRRYYPSRAYYSTNYGPRSFLRDPDFYPAMPWYPFHGVGPYPYGTYDPYDTYGGDYEECDDDEDHEPEDDEKEGEEEEDDEEEDEEEEEEEDDGEEGSTHTELPI
jgi:hypothetical protein